MARSRSNSIDPPSSPREAGAWTRFALPAAIAVLCAATYHGIADNYLFNDDFSWLRAARYDMTWSNILSFRVVNFFRPLINITFFAMERFSPGNLRLHYACNLILHFLNTVLVFHLLDTILRRRNIAAATAILFAVSSLHTGSVFWISARTTLLSVLLLLLALLAATRGAKRKSTSLVAATVFFILALAAKETAIAGLPLVILLYALRRAGKGEYELGGGTLVSFSIVSIIYLIVRTLVMGGFIQQNWGPGLHAVRNAAGGFLYELYPFPLFSLFMPSGTSIAEPAHPFLPEVIAVPLIVCLLWIGAATRRLTAFILAVGWMILSLIPASAFRYRFFSTVSITQNRYYYLSSVGALLLVTLLLALLWSERSRVRRALCVILFVLLVAGSMLRVHRLERKWDDFTGMYREIVAMLAEEIEKRDGFTTIAIENPPLAFPFIADAVLLEARRGGHGSAPTAPAGIFQRPPYDVVEVEGGRGAAERYRPCLYISYTGDYPKVMKIKQLE